MILSKPILKTLELDIESDPTVVGRKLTTLNPFLKDVDAFEEDRFPYLCSLRKRKSNAEVDACIGTLIAPRWALAAADCLNPALPNSAGKRPVLYCGGGLYHEQIFNTIEISIHDINKRQNTPTLNFALIKLDREAKGPFPVLASYDALNEDTQLAVPSRKRTGMNVPVTVLHKISARELQSAKQFNEASNSMKPETDFGVRGEIQLNSDSTRTTPVRDCANGGCGAPIFAPNDVMNGTVKVGSGDSDVVVGFAFFFGDAATLVRFANATLQYIKPLFKCATEKACTPSPSPSTLPVPVPSPSPLTSPLTHPLPWVPVSPTSPSSSPVQPAPSTPVVSPSPETLLHHSVKETEHEMHASTETVVKPPVISEPEPSKEEKEETLSISAPEVEPEVIQTKTVPVPVLETEPTEEETVPASAYEIESAKEETVSVPAPATEAKKEATVAAPVPASTEKIAVTPIPVPETIEEAKVLTPVPEPKSMEETKVSAPVPEPETTEKTQSLPPVPVPKSMEETTVSAPVLEPETTEKTQLTLPVSVPETTEEVTVSAPIPAPDSTSEEILIPAPLTEVSLPAPVEKLITSIPSVELSPTEQILFPETTAPSPVIEPSVEPLMSQPGPPPSVSVVLSPSPKPTKSPKPLKSPKLSKGTLPKHCPKNLTEFEQMDDAKKFTIIKQMIVKDDNEGIRSVLCTGLNVKKTFGQQQITLLHLAARSNAAKSIGILMECGADINAEDSNGRTPIFATINVNATAAAQVLAKYKPDFGHYDNFGFTALIQSALQNRVIILRVIIKGGADLEAPCKNLASEGDTALFIAAALGCVKSVAELLRHGAEVNILDKRGISPLFDAAKQGHTTIAKLLIKAGAKTDVVDKEGNTALHCAAEGGYIIIVKEKEEEDKIAKYWQSVQEREAKTESQKKQIATAAEQAYIEICKEHESTSKAKQDEERLLELLYLEEQEQKLKDAKSLKLQTQAKLRQDLINENERLLKFKSEQEEKRKQEEAEFRSKMLTQFAEEDKIDQLNAQKRRQKQIQHRRDVERMIQERRMAWNKQKELEEQEEQARRAAEQQKAELIEHEKTRLLMEAESLQELVTPQTRINCKVHLETISDIDEKTISESSLHRHGEHYTETLGSEGVGGSDLESNVDMEEDSEATVSEDLNIQGSESETLESAGWQPSPRLTARQQARQQRLLQGIQQTQWNDMSLPRNLDFSNKNKQKDVLSEEQHLKRLKDAEVRRLRTQKARRDTMEFTKARIRASTSNKFKDMLGNGQVEKRKIVRPSISFLPGRVKIRKSINRTALILPKEADLPSALQPRSFAQYPVQKVVEEFKLDLNCFVERSILGKQVEVLPKGPDRVGIVLEGIRILTGVSQSALCVSARTGTVIGVHYGQNRTKLKKIKIRLN
eukprot:g3956.t1